MEMGYTPNNLLFHRETDDKQGDFDDFRVAYQTNPNDLMVYMWNPPQMGPSVKGFLYWYTNSTYAYIWI